MERRDLFKLTGLGIAAAATTTLTGCQNQPEEPSLLNKKQNMDTLKETIFTDKKRKRVVIVGGGISGLSLAGSLRATDVNKNFEIIVLEKNKRFHACPGSNILLTKTASEYAKEIGAPAQWIFNYHKVKEDFMNNGDIIVTECEVIGGDTKSKVLKTTKGNIAYDTLVLGTGIEYDYESQFPTWDKTKIEKARLLTPGAMIQDAGDEWTNMSHRWEELITKAKANPKKKYSLVINPTPKTNRDGEKTLRRCPPAASERVSTLASRVKKEGLKNLKVYVILELNNKLGSKHAAFKQSWSKLGYCKDISNPTSKDIIQPIFNARITDIDFDKKIISYSQLDSEDIKKISYNEAIIMPYHKTPAIIGKIFNTDDEIQLVEDGFEVEDFPNHYILGDSQSTHALPASGSMAMSIAGFLSNRIIDQLNGKDTPEDYSEASNVCYSMVGEAPNRGIKVMHTFYTSGDGIIRGKGLVPKENGLYMSHGIVLEQGGWLFGIGGLFLATGEKRDTQLNR